MRPPIVHSSTRSKFSMHFISVWHSCGCTYPSRFPSRQILAVHVGLLSFSSWRHNPLPLPPPRHFVEPSTSRYSVLVHTTFPGFNVLDILYFTRPRVTGYNTTSYHSSLRRSDPVGANITFRIRAVASPSLHAPPLPPCAGTLHSKTISMHLKP